MCCLVTHGKQTNIMVNRTKMGENFTWKVIFFGHIMAPTSSNIILHIYSIISLMTMNKLWFKTIINVTFLWMYPWYKISENVELHLFNICQRIYNINDLHAILMFCNSFLKASFTLPRISEYCLITDKG